MRSFNFLFGGFVLALIVGLISLTTVVQLQSHRIERLEGFVADYQWEVSAVRDRFQDAKINLAAMEQAVLQHRMGELEASAGLLAPSLPLAEVPPAPSTEPDGGRYSNPVYRTPKQPEVSK